MTHISATGNLAWTPELRKGERGPFCYAAVIVNDRYRDPNGEWVDAAATRYDLTVYGSQAENLVRTANSSGNVRVQFSGDLTRVPWRDGDEQGVNNRVRVSDIGVSLRGNVEVNVTKPETSAEATTAAFPSPAREAVAEAPAPTPAAAPSTAPESSTDLGR